MEPPAQSWNVGGALPGLLGGPLDRASLQNENPANLSAPDGTAREVTPPIVSTRYSTKEKLAGSSTTPPSPIQTNYNHKLEDLQSLIEPPGPAYGPWKVLTLHWVIRISLVYIPLRATFNSALRLQPEPPLS